MGWQLPVQSTSKMTHGRIRKSAKRQPREGGGEKRGEYLARQHVLLERFLGFAPLEAVDVPAGAGLPHAGVCEGQKVVQALLHR
jgi:hypothetical protein